MRTFESDFFERRRFDVDNNRIKRVKRIEELTDELNRLSYLLQNANGYLMELEYEGKVGSINYIITLGYLETIKVDMKEYTIELEKILLSQKNIQMFLKMYFPLGKYVMVYYYLKDDNFYLTNLLSNNNLYKLLNDTFALFEILNTGSAELIPPIITFPSPTIFKSLLIFNPYSL